MESLAISSYLIMQNIGRLRKPIIIVVKAPKTVCFLFVKSSFIIWWGAIPGNCSRQEWKKTSSFLFVSPTKPTFWLLQSRVDSSKSYACWRVAYIFCSCISIFVGGPVGLKTIEKTQFLVHTSRRHSAFARIFLPRMSVFRRGVGWSWG